MSEQTKKNPLKQYLGDAVYANAEFTASGTVIELTIEDGEDTIHVIFLEPEVLAALDRYREWLKEKAKEIKPA